MKKLLRRNMAVLGCCMVAVVACAAEVKQRDNREPLGKDEGVAGIGGGCFCCLYIGIPGPGIVIHTPYKIGVTGSFVWLFLYPPQIWHQGDAQIIYDIRKGKNFYLYVGTGIGYCLGEDSDRSGKGIVGSLGIDVILPRPRLFGFSNGSDELSPKREFIVGVRLPYLLYGERIREDEDYSRFLLPIPYVHFSVDRF